MPTISPDVLSHYVPGDTPTLYASSRPNSSSFPDEHPLQSNSGGTAFTFFGVPIPPLNFNNIWGQTKGTGKRLKDSRRNSLPKKTSAVEQDSFTSMLPGSGGFRPTTTTDRTLFEKETGSEDDVDTIHKNKSTLHKFTESSGSTRYHYSSTTEPPFYYNKFSNSDNNFSKFVNITTRDSLFESATINSIIRSTAKPNLSNQLQTTTAATILQSDISVDQSERPPKLSTGNIISFEFKILCVFHIMLLRANN